MNEQAFPKRKAPRRIYRKLFSVLILLALFAGLAFYWSSQRRPFAWHFSAGVDAFARKDLDRVQVAVEVFQDVDGYEPHLRLFEGMVLLRSGRLFDAIETFGHARDHPDTRALAYGLSGEALYKAGVFRDALHILATAIELDPSQTDARRWLAALYYDVGAMGHALKQLEAVAEAAPEDPRPHRLMGLIHKDYERYGLAIGNYRESLRRDPDQPEKQEILAELSECLVRQRQHAEALETLRQCPRSAKMLALEADCRYGQGDVEAARRLVDEALVLEPGRLEALDLKATMQLAADDVQSAMETLLQAAEHHPKEYALRYRLAGAYQRLNEPELAKEQLEAMKQLRALRDRFTKLHEDAMEDPTNAETRYQLGLVARQLDKPEIALSWLKMTLALDPDHPGAREAVSAMLAQPAPAQTGPGSDPE
jgi:tetratricopeptide (TPR) repeat protein